MEKRAMTGAVMAIIAVILIGITLALPWFTFTSKMQGNGNADFYFDHVVMSNGQNRTSMSYESLEKIEPNVVSVFQNTEIWDIVGLVFAIIGFIGAILLAVGKLGKGVAVSLVAIGFILSLVAPIYFYAALPAAVKTDTHQSEPFFGSDQFGSWGGGIGWWLAIVGMIFMLLALIFVAIARKPQLVAPPPMAPTPPEAMPPAPPMEGQTGQTETENIPPPRS